MNQDKYVMQILKKGLNINYFFKQQPENQQVSTSTLLCRHMC